MMAIANATQKIAEMVIASNNFRFMRSATPQMIGPQKVRGRPHSTGTSETKNGEPVVSKV